MEEIRNLNLADFMIGILIQLSEFTLVVVLIGVSSIHSSTFAKAQVWA